MKSNIIKSSFIVVVLSLIAKVIGLGKTIVQSSYFGATISTDAFNIANGFVGDIFFMLSTAVAVAFVPLYIQKKQDGNEYEFASETISLLSVFSIIVTIIAILISPDIIKLIAPGFQKEERGLATDFLRVICISFIFSIGTNLYTNLLNAEKKYGYSTFCSIINSLVLIVGIPLFGKVLGTWVLAISVPVSYIIQLVVLYIPGKKYAKISLRVCRLNDSIKLLVKQSFPILLGQATVEINQMIDRALLSSVGEGVLTAVSYSSVLYQFASTLINMPIQTVMFTELSEAGAKKDYKRLSSLLMSCYKVSVIVCIPVMLTISITSIDIVEMILGHGSFNGKAIDNCALGLVLYGLCLWPVCVKTILTRAYYALNDTKRPMIIGTMEVILNTVMSIVTASRYGVKGIVGSTAFASFVFIIVMLIDFNRHHVNILNKDNVKGTWKYIFGIMICCVISYGFKNIFLMNYFVDFLIKAFVNVGLFFATLLALKDETILYLLRYLNRTGRR